MFSIFGKIFKGIANNPNINVLFIGQLFVKSALIFYISFYTGIYINNLFPQLDESKSSSQLWLEISSQAGLIGVVAFFIRPILDSISDEFDLTNSVGSRLTNKGASFLFGLGIFSTQSNLKDKYSFIQSQHK